MNGADWLLAALAAEGMPVLFGNPGSTELPLTDALGRQSAVRYVLAHGFPAIAEQMGLGS